MIKKLYWLLIISLPFSSIGGPEIFGEISRYLSTYVFIILVSVFFLKPITLPKGVGYIFFLFFLLLIAIGISFIANIEHMLSGAFRGRTALNKFVTSGLVIVLGFFISYVSFCCTKDYYKNIIRPLYIGVVLCVVASIPEVIAWYSDGFKELYRPVSALLHSDGRAYMTVHRLRSLAFEPSFLSLYLGFAMVWMLAAARLNTPARLYYRLAFISIIAMIVLSESRTGYVFCLGVVIMDFITFRTLSSRSPIMLSILRSLSTYYIVLILSVAALVIFNYENLVDGVVEGKSVSNLSRFASNTAAFRVFSEFPILGGGLGQYAFHAVKVMPEWGYYSYEIVTWFTDPSATWPPCFTMFGRLGAELGVVGLMVWYGYWLWLMARILHLCVNYRMTTGRAPIYGNALVSGVLYVILCGVAQDSVSLPSIWIQLGLCCLYIAKPYEENHVR